MQHRTFSKKLKIKKKPPTQRGGLGPFLTSEATRVAEAVKNNEEGASPNEIAIEMTNDTPLLVGPLTKIVTTPSEENGAFQLPKEINVKKQALMDYFKNTYIDGNYEVNIGSKLINLLGEKKLLSLPFSNEKAFIEKLKSIEDKLAEKKYDIPMIDEILAIAREVKYEGEVIKDLQKLKIQKFLKDNTEKKDAIQKNLSEISLYNINPIQELILLLNAIGLYKEDQMMLDLKDLYNKIRKVAIDNNIFQDFEIYDLITMKNIENIKYDDWVIKDKQNSTYRIGKADKLYKGDPAKYSAWLKIHKAILDKRAELAKVFFPISSTVKDAAPIAEDTKPEPEAEAEPEEKEKEKIKDAEDNKTEVVAKALGDVVSKISPKGLSAAFNILYDLLALIGAVLVVVFFLLALSDFGVYLLNEIKQKKFLIFDPNLFNQDTSEYKALKYNSNDTKSEPYNIYLEQNIIKQMYRIVGIFFVVIGLQIGSFLAFKLLASLKNQEFEESLEKPKNIGVIVTVLTAGLVLSAYYKNKFLNTIQPVFKGTQNRMTNMKDYIYNHMTTNVEFLEALLSNNVSVLIELMAKQQTAYSLSKMLFTFSLYNYFKTNVPESDEETEEIRSIFTIQQIRTQTVDPIKYFYYRQNIFIPNMYVTIKNNLITKKCPVIATASGVNEEKETNFRMLMNSQVLELNRGLLQLLKLPKRKKQLLFYLVMTLLISSVFVIALMVMYKDQVAEVWAIIQPYLAKIWEKITSLFSSKKAA